MVNENIVPPEENQPEERPKILTLPLPQILDEMEVNIRATAEATRVAEEAVSIAEGAIPRSLVRRIIASRDFLAFILVILLASIFSAIAISIGLNLLGLITR